MKIPRVANRKRHSRRGAYTVEFAVTIPLVFLVLFASWDFSRANAMLHTIANAAYEGCRRGIVPGASADDVRDEVSSVLSAGFVQAASVTVTPPKITQATSAVKVSITVPMNQNAWVASLFLKNRTFATSCTLQRERIEAVTVP